MKALEFTGSGKEYFKIWIVNIVLIIITLGIYYPWAKVRNKRYFYANTNLENRNFEYHATGKQLLVGYLIAMGVLIAYVIFNTVAPLVGLMILLVIGLALPWIIVRSMVFNMKMTSFSNINFSFSGEKGDAYTRYLLTPSLIFILIGLFTVIPFYIMILLGGGQSTVSIVFLVICIILICIAVIVIVVGLSYIKKISTEFLLNNSKYGQGKFKVTVEINAFVLILFKTIGISILSVIVSSILIGASWYLVFETEEYSSELYQSSLLLERAVLLIPMIIFYGSLIVSGIFIMAYKMVKEREYIFKNTTLDEKVKFASSLEPLAFGWILLSNLLLILLTLGFATPWTKVRVAQYILSHTFVESQEGLDIFITEKTQEQSALGEQIGDAFDVDVGVGM